MKAFEAQNSGLFGKVASATTEEIWRETADELTEIAASKNNPLLQFAVVRLLLKHTPKPLASAAWTFLKVSAKNLALQTAGKNQLARIGINAAYPILSGLGDSAIREFQKDENREPDGRVKEAVLDRELKPVQAKFQEEVQKQQLLFANEEKRHFTQLFFIFHGLAGEKDTLWIPRIREYKLALSEIVLSAQEQGHRLGITEADVNEARELAPKANQAYSKLLHDRKNGTDKAIQKSKAGYLELRNKLMDIWSTKLHDVLEIGGDQVLPSVSWLKLYQAKAADWFDGLNDHENRSDDPTPWWRRHRWTIRVVVGSIAGALLTATLLTLWLVLFGLFGWPSFGVMVSDGDRLGGILRIAHKLYLVVAGQEEFTGTAADQAWRILVSGAMAVCGFWLMSLPTSFVERVGKVFRYAAGVTAFVTGGLLIAMGAYAFTESDSWISSATLAVLWPATGVVVMGIGALLFGMPVERAFGKGDGTPVARKAMGIAILLCLAGVGFAYFRIGIQEVRPYVPQQAVPFLYAADAELMTCNQEITQFRPNTREAIVAFYDVVKTDTRNNDYLKACATYICPDAKAAASRGECPACISQAENWKDGLWLFGQLGQLGMITQSGARECWVDLCQEPAMHEEFGSSCDEHAGPANQP